MAAYLNHGAKAADIVAYIEQVRKMELDVKAAQILIDRRGGFSAALRREDARN